MDDTVLENAALLESYTATQSTAQRRAIVHALLHATASREVFRKRYTDLAFSVESQIFQVSEAREACAPILLSDAAFACLGLIIANYCS